VFDDVVVKLSLCFRRKNGNDKEKCLLVPMKLNERTGWFISYDDRRKRSKRKREIKLDAFFQFPSTC